MTTKIRDLFAFIDIGACSIVFWMQVKAGVTSTFIAAWLVDANLFRVNYE